MISSSRDGTNRYPATLAVDGTTPNKLTQNDADLLA
jgi:hypothetical protein